MITAAKRKYSNKMRKYSEEMNDLSFIVCDNEVNNMGDSNEYFFDNYHPKPASRKNSCYILHSDEK